MIRAIGLVSVSSKKQTEGVSLDEQEKAIRALCDKHGWQLGETVKLPGVSRSNRDMLDYFTDDNPKHAPFRYLRDRIKSGEYQCLVSYDNGRIGRTTSLFTYLARLAIDYRMIVATHMTGIINEDNATFAIPIAAMNAEGEVKRRIDMTARAKAARVERGLHLGVPPISHYTVRDERGKALRLELRTDTRRLIDDAATLVMEGVGWHKIAFELRDRFGHALAHNAFYGSTFWYRFFHHPYVWGVAARGYDHRQGLWVIDETIPLPPGVVVSRNPSPPIPPAFTGATAERLRNELRRRRDIIKGHATPSHTHRFTGLLVCGVCGLRLGIVRSRTRYYWACPCHKIGRKHPHPCHQPYLRDDMAQLQINDFLAGLFARNGTDIAAFATPQDTNDPRLRMDALTAEITALNDEIATMITQQSKAPLAVQEHYARLITEAGERLDVLRANLAESRAAVPSPEHARARQNALAEIRGMSMETFWQLSSREINQRLHAVLGHYRFIVKDGYINDVR